MASDWENPRSGRDASTIDRNAPFAQRDGSGTEPARATGDGLIHPRQLLILLRQKFWQIALLSSVVFALLMGAVLLYPFAYKATALVFVDPRQQAVNPTQEVLPAIGTDAANLESVVQVVQSEGFLLALLDRLDLSGDPDFAKLEDRREKLKVFKKNLSVSRRGATYLVDIAYKTTDADRAARYANAVAESFVEQQNSANVDAAENAATSLSGRLGELRENLRQSEIAVAEFKDEKDIIDIDTATTLSQRDMSNISEQIALAQARTAEAKSRYENQLAAESRNSQNGGSASASNELALLLRDQKAVNREVATLEKTYGRRHPRLVAALEEQASIASQIAVERARVADTLKKVYESALQEQQDLEARLTEKSQTVTSKGADQVELADLERQAAANRAIYEQYLARYKATDEQKMLPVDNVRIVSLAIPPLTTTRPSLTLIGAVLAVLSGLVALTIVLANAIRRGMAGHDAKSVEAAEPVRRVRRQDPVPALQEREEDVKEEVSPTATASVSPFGRRDAVRAEEAVSPSSVRAAVTKASSEVSTDRHDRETVPTAAPGERKAAPRRAVPERMRYERSAVSQQSRQERARYQGSLNSKSGEESELESLRRDIAAVRSQLERVRRDPSRRSAQKSSQFEKTN